MKNFKIILLLLVILGIYSCETYKDPETEYSPIYPLSGQWYVQVYDANVDTLLSPISYTMYTYNTASNTSDSMWVYIPEITKKPSLFKLCGEFRSKVACRVSDKSFGTTSLVSNNLDLTKSIKIDNGSVILSGGKTLGGSVADSVAFMLTTKLSSESTTKSFKIKGVRVSGWPEDMP